MNKHMSNDEFLTSLTSLFAGTHASSHGSVFLVQKPMPSLLSEPSTTEAPRILVRATNGKSARRNESKPTKSSKIKLSTIVDEHDLAAFYAKYAEVCKKGMEGLRKRDKKKAKAKRKKKNAVTEIETKKVG